jgi:hypothetical protein
MTGKAIPSAIFKANGVLPDVDSGIVLPTGTYTIATDSTVPFVRFKGSSFGEKTISWNDRIHIPKGENIQVFNASHHKGDIYLTNDFESYTRPDRITIPFTWSIPIGEVEQGNTVTPAWNNDGLPLAKADCRIARRVFAAVTFLIQDEPGNNDLTIFGQHKLHANSQSVGGVVPNGYSYSPVLTPLSTLNLIPLGYAAINNFSPMALLDTAWFSFLYDVDGIADYGFGGYYIIEY